MQVRLTEEGQKALGFLPDRKVVVVSDERAFALMSGGYAVKDKGFMALFDGPLPEKPKEKQPKPEPKKESPTAEDRQKMIDKKFPPEPKKKVVEPKKEPKKETATSKKAENRKKAVKK